MCLKAQMTVFLVLGRGRVWRNYALKKNFLKSLMIVVFLFDLWLHHRLALGKSLCTGKSGVAPSNVSKNEKLKNCMRII